MVDEPSLKFIYYFPPPHSNFCWPKLIRAQQKGKHSLGGVAQVRQGISQGPSRSCLWMFDCRKLGEAHVLRMHEQSQVRINCLLSFLPLFKLLILKDTKDCLWSLCFFVWLFPQLNLIFPLKKKNNKTTFVNSSHNSKGFAFFSFFYS